MGNGYLLSLQPTFTQGFILGQLSVLVLLVLILKYLFLDSTKSPFETSSYHPRANSDVPLRNQKLPRPETEEEILDKNAEPMEWFSLLVQQVVETYRSSLRDNIPGADGDEIARKRIEDLANAIRPPALLDHIKIHSIDLGHSAPHFSNAHVNCQKPNMPTIELDLHYTDTLSLSLSTSYLFNYPMASFARLPVSLTISLSLFESSVTIIPPCPTSPTPSLTISISPDFKLDLTTTSLMGSRAKLANVPKLHELIHHQLRQIVAARTYWKIELPGLSTESEPNYAKDVS